MTTSQQLAFLLAATNVAATAAFPLLSIMILYRLRDNGPMLASPLAESLGRPRGTADVSYSILLSQGLIEIVSRDPLTRGNPQRVFAITSSGRALLRRIGGDSFLLANPATK